jgi:hypothetical protein
VAVERLEETLASGDVTRAREEIRGHVGTVTVDADEREIRLWGDKGEFVAVLLRAAGHTSNCGGGGTAGGGRCLGLRELAPSL